MRWLVEVTSINKTEKFPYCVEADSWQRALQSARALRGETGPMSGFSIELLDVGYRAVDPMARLVYIVNRAADDAPLTQADASIATRPSVAPPPAPRTAARGASAPPPKPASIPAPPKAPSVAPPAPAPVAAPVAAAPAARPISVPAPARGSAPPAASGSNRPQTMGFASAGTAVLHDIARAATAEVADPTPAVAPVPPPPPMPEGLPATQIIFKREQDPTAASPLTYREYVFAVAADTSEADAERLIFAQFALVRHALSAARAGKLVNLAVFDVVFAGRPPVRPLVTLVWKDWKKTPETHFPRRDPSRSMKPVETPSAVPAPHVPPAAATTRDLAEVHDTPPTPEAAPPIAAAPIHAAPIADPAPAPSPELLTFPKPASDRVRAAPPASGAQATPPPWKPSDALPGVPLPKGLDVPPLSAPISVAMSSQMPGSNGPVSLLPTPSVRVRGDELITSLFEAMHDLHFLRDAVEGGVFCLGLALEKVPSRVGLVHLYDIDHREFVVSCALGAGADTLLLYRTPENDTLLKKAMRKTRAVVLNDATNAEAARSDRFRTLGGAKSVIVAPVVLAGRFLGAIELFDPLDGEPFTDTDGYALTYIAEQYAEFVSTRGVVIDPDRIRKPFDSASRLR